MNKQILRRLAGTILIIIALVPLIIYIKGCSIPPDNVPEELSTFKAVPFKAAYNNLIGSRYTGDRFEGNGSGIVDTVSSFDEIRRVLGVASNSDLQSTMKKALAVKLGFSQKEVSIEDIKQLVLYTCKDYSTMQLPHDTGTYVVSAAVAVKEFSVTKSSAFKAKSAVETIDSTFPKIAIDINTQDQSFTLAHGVVLYFQDIHIKNYDRKKAGFDWSENKSKTIDSYNNNDTNYFNVYSVPKEDVIGFDNWFNKQFCVRMEFSASAYDNKVGSVLFSPEKNYINAKSSVSKEQKNNYVPIDSFSIRAPAEILHVATNPNIYKYYILINNADIKYGRFHNFEKPLGSSQNYWGTWEVESSGLATLTIDHWTYSY